MSGRLLHTHPQSKAANADDASTSSSSKNDLSSAKIGSPATKLAPKLKTYLAQSRPKTDRPCVVIIAVSPEDLDDRDLIPEIARHIPEAQIVSLPMNSSPSRARREPCAGASSSVLKQESARHICEAIRNLLNGIACPAENIAAPSQTAAIDLQLLTEREREVFRALRRGNSTRQIADAFNISIKTVQVHCSHIRKKLRLRNQMELHVTAIRWDNAI